MYQGKTYLSKAVNSTLLYTVLSQIGTTLRVRMSSEKTGTSILNLELNHFEKLVGIK